MAEKTAYHVLRLSRPQTKTGDETTPEAWEVVATGVLAHNADNAIRQHCENAAQLPKADVGGSYVAVPSRSWKPTFAKAETTITVKVGG